MGVSPTCFLPGLAPRSDWCTWLKATVCFPHFLPRATEEKGYDVEASALDPSDAITTWLHPNIQALNPNGLVDLNGNVEGIVSRLVLSCFLTAA